MESGLQINGFEIVKKLVFMVGGQWKLSVGKKQVDLNLIGLEGTSACDENSVSIIFETVKKARLCQGKPVGDKVSRTSHDSVDNWSTIGDENSEELRVRSSHCHGVVPFSACVNICRPCQNCCLESQTNQTAPKVSNEDNSPNIMKLIDNLGHDETNDVIRKLFFNPPLCTDFHPGSVVLESSAKLSLGCLANNKSLV